MIRDYPAPPDLVPELTSQDKKDNAERQKVRDRDFAFQKDVHDRTIAALPKIKDYLSQHPPGSSGRGGIASLRAIAALARGDTSFRPNISADKIAFQNAVDSANYAAIGQGFGPVQIDSPFRLSDTIANAYRQGYLDDFIEQPTLKPVASAPAAAAQNLAVPARPAAEAADDHGFHGNAKPFADGAPPKAATASPAPAMPVKKGRMAGRAYMDGVTTYMNPRELKAVQAQTQQRLEGKAARVESDMKGTELDQPGLHVSHSEAIKLMAGNETKLTPYLLEAIKHGDIDLHAAAHQDRLAEILVANPGMKQQFAIIAHNQGHVTEDGQPDLKAIAHEFAKAEHHAASRRLAYTRADGTKAHTARELFDIALDRTTNYDIAPNMAVAMKTDDGVKPPSAKPASDTAVKTAKPKHLASNGMIPGGV